MKKDEIHTISTSFDENTRTMYVMYKHSGILKITFYEKDKNTLWISDLAVDPTCYKQGIARKLIEACEEIALRNYITVIGLKVKTGSWMHEWYNRMSYYNYFTEDGYTELIKQLKY